MRYPGGGSGSSRKAWTVLRSVPGPVAQGLFPPAQVAEVKALACELPAEKGVPLSRWSSAELAREAVARGIVERISGVTVWRWLSADAIRPWNYRSWIFRRDPEFRQKAGRILDLYEGRWEGELLEPGDFVVCADEKPSIQARGRIHESEGAKPGGDGQLVEHEYDRQGALCYLAAWDVKHARIFDRCAPKDGIEPFDALVEQFMSIEPYSKAQRVFLVIETMASNCTSGGCGFGFGGHLGGIRDALAALLFDLRRERDAQAVAVAVASLQLPVADPVIHRAG